MDPTNERIIVSRDLLGSLLEDLEARADLAPLSPHERESLEQLAVAVMSEEAQVAIPGELVELWRSSA